MHQPAFETIFNELGVGDDFQPALQADDTRDVVLEAFTTAGFLPVSFVGFVILFFGRSALFSWIAHPLEKKAVWLNVPFMSLRIAVGSLALYWVAIVLSSREAARLLLLSWRRHRYYGLGIVSLAALLVLVIFVLLAGSMALVWWTYSRQLLPIQKRSKGLSAAVGRLSLEVEAMEKAWSKEDAERMLQQLIQ